MIDSLISSLVARINRRRFLSAAGAAICAGTGQTTKGSSGELAPPPLTVKVGPAERPRTDLEAWNVGLITAWRPGLTSEEYQARDRQLWGDLTRSAFGRLHVRGRYVEDYGSVDAKGHDVLAYLLIGNSDDSGNLKGFLRKTGRNYEQDAVIHKGYYRDAELHALKDLPGLGVREKEKMSLGRFNPDSVGHYFTLMTRGGDGHALAWFEELRNGPTSVDWLGGFWEDIGIWTPKSFFAREERRVYFERAIS